MAEWSATVHTYEDAIALLKTRKRKVSHNTYLRPGPPPCIRLHNTDIVIFHPNGDVELQSGGWKTVTTKDRMNTVGCRGWSHSFSFSVYSHKTVWWLTTSKVDVPYADGILIHPDGTVSNYGEDPAKEIKLRGQLKRFAKNYIKALVAGKVPAPGSGDCWGCLMVADDGTTPMGGKDHILSHVEEKYYVPSMLAHAIERFPVSMFANQYLASFWDGNADLVKTIQESSWSSGIGTEQLQKSLTRHLYRECGLPT